MKRSTVMEICNLYGQGWSVENVAKETFQTVLAVEVLLTRVAGRGFGKSFAALKPSDAWQAYKILTIL